MTFFKKRMVGASRRHDRLWKQHIKRLAVGFTALALVTVVGVYGATHGMYAQGALWAHEKFLSGTSALGFQVGNILVTGRGRISQDEVLSHLAISKGDPVFGIDLLQAQEKMQSIRWVKDVRLSRKLPDTVVVDITERTPLALWQYKKKIALIDAEGHVLASDNLEKYKDLPLVVGEDAPAHVTEIVALMQAEPDIAREIASAVRVGQRRWDLRLKNGIDIRLPEKDVELALRRLVDAAQKDGLLKKDIKVIDLRIADRLVVGPVIEKGVSG